MRLKFWASDAPALIPESEVSREKEFGATGTSNYNGYLIQSEFNPDLRGTAAYDVWEEMRRSDASVRETIWHIFAPILNANWSIEPPLEPDDDELEQAEFIRCAFFEWLDQPFAELMRNVLSYVEMGNAVFETTFKVEERALTMHVTKEQEETDPADELKLGEDGAPPPPPLPPGREKVTLPSRQFITWRKFAHRLPKTIWRWNTDAYGDLLSVVQLAPKTQPGAKVPTGQRGPDGALPMDVPEAALGAPQDWRMLPIPAQYLLVFTHDKWGDEFSGISLLRAAYKPWWLKQMIERTMGLSYERYGVGVPVAYIPSDREQDTKLIDEIETMLTNLRAGDQNFLIFPGSKATHTRPGYDFEIISPGSTFPSFVEALEYLRGEIAGAMLARFKELGMSQTGARATASIQSEVWYNLLHAIARYIEDQFQLAIKRLIDMNYSGVTRYPRLQASGIEARDLLAFSQSVALLVNSEVLLPDTPLRAWVREFVDAPAEDASEANARLKNNALQQNVQNQSDLGFGRGPETEPSQTARPRVENAKGNADTEDHVLAALLEARRMRAAEPVVVATAPRRKLTPIRAEDGTITTIEITEED